MKDDTSPPGLRSLANARPGLRENVGDWLRSRLGKPGRDGVPERRNAPPLLVPQDEAMLADSPAVEVALHEPLPPAAPAPGKTSDLPPRAVTVIAAPHPVSRRLFADMAALASMGEPAGPPVVLQLATSPEEAGALTRDVEIYLRSECSGACRIVAALGAREPARIGAATWLLTWLEHNYWRSPAVIVESALRDPPYLLERLGDLLGLSFGPAAVARAALLFAARTQDAEAYCDPLGYMEAIEVGGSPGSQGPRPAAAGPPARGGRRAAAPPAARGRV